MSENTNTNDKRPQKVCLLGFITQILFSAGLWTLATMYQSETIEVLARLMQVGIPIWLVLYLLFTQMWRVGAESLETAELKRMLTPEKATGRARLAVDEARFRWKMNADAMATEKLAEGIRNFDADHEKLLHRIAEKLA